MIAAKLSRHGTDTAEVVTMKNKCPNCGKVFDVSTLGWGYAYGNQYTCSYGCMRAMEVKKAMTREQKEEVKKLLGTGLSSVEIAEKVGVKPQAVYDFRRALKEGGADLSKPVQEPESKPIAEKVFEPVEAVETEDDALDMRAMTILLLHDVLTVLKRMYPEGEA
jgi:transposase